MTDSVKVAVRVRPFNQRELTANSSCVISMNGQTTTLFRRNNPSDKKTFSYDHSYWSHDGFITDDKGVHTSSTPNSKYADQQKVFSDLGQGVLDNAWKGYNAALFAYGQTGSGKSYSMIGYGANKGIVPITCAQLFQAIEENTDSRKQFQVTFSMLEIYNEQVSDLLVSARNVHGKSSRGGLRVRKRPGSGFYCEGLKQVPVESYADIERLMNEGVLNRTTASTNMNATSSRSHMVITIGFKQVFPNEQGQSTTKTSEISLVDLAGSERAKSTLATGDRLKEGSAINLSLLTLGNVIHALADASSKKKKMNIPYRGSVLTKLLMSALGGNSKTIMIAALSPAAINYEETLSTLRYADRAKQIQTKAVINESLTDKLIRELKEENQKLLEQLQKLQIGDVTGDKALNVQMLLEENQRQMDQVALTWEQRLEEAKKEWQKEQEVSPDETKSAASQNSPFLTNVNEDPQLSGVIKFILQKGENTLGKPGQPSVNIGLRGLGIQSRHAVATNNGTEMAISKGSKQAAITINGIPLTKSKSVLKHHDRIKLGSNNLYLYIGFPEERAKEEHPIEYYTYDFFQTELAEQSGFNEKDLVGSDEDDSEIMKVYREYVDLLPKVQEANAISDDLKKDLKFEIEVKNLATHDARGRTKQKDITVRIENSSQKIWIWSKDKFENRKFMMDALYHRWLDGENVDVMQQEDPFWDPVEEIFLGSCHVWLSGLAYCMESDEHLDVRNYKGKTVGRLHLKLNPCDALGQPLLEEMLVLDPLELHGRRLDVLVCIPEGSTLQWVVTDPSRGAYCRFTFYNQPELLQTKVAWSSINPRFSFRKQLTVKHIDDKFLAYLQNSALVVELWGTQTESNQENGSSIGFRQPADDTEATVLFLQEKLQKQEHQLKALQKDQMLLQQENDRLQRQLSSSSLPLTSATQHLVRKKSTSDMGLSLHGDQPITRRNSQTKIGLPRRKSSLNHAFGHPQPLSHADAPSQLSPRSPRMPMGDAFSDSGDPVMVSVKHITPSPRLHHRLSSSSSQNNFFVDGPVLPSIPNPSVVTLGGALKRPPTQTSSGSGMVNSSGRVPNEASAVPSVVGVEVEIIKALKKFFKDMKDVQRMMKKLKQSHLENGSMENPNEQPAPSQQTVLEDMDSELQTNLQGLKDVVLSIVRKARNNNTGDTG